MATAVARPILSDGKGAAEVMHGHAAIGPKASEMKIPDAGRSAAVVPQAMEVEIEVSSPGKGGEDALAFEDLPWQCLTCSPVHEGAEEGGPIEEELHPHADADASENEVPMPEAEQAHAPQPDKACEAVGSEVASAAPMPEAEAAHGPEGDAAPDAVAPEIASAAPMPEAEAAHAPEADAVRDAVAPEGADAAAGRKGKNNNYRQQKILEGRQVLQACEHEDLKISADFERVSLVRKVALRMLDYMCPVLSEFFELTNSF